MPISGQCGKKNGVTGLLLLVPQERTSTGLNMKVACFLHFWISIVDVLEDFICDKKRFKRLFLYYAN